MCTLIIRAWKNNLITYKFHFIRKGKKRKKDGLVVGLPYINYLSIKSTKMEISYFLATTVATYKTLFCLFNVFTLKYSLISKKAKVRPE